MTTPPRWTDDYWPLLIQLYVQRPVGMKPMYSRGMVELSMELHIPPRSLYGMMFSLRRQDSPAIAQLWQRYGHDRRGLARAVRTVRRMTGFCSGGLFYEGVTVAETFETDFRPIDGCGGMMPVMLILLLDLYFRLTPATMVDRTPEVRQMARLMKMDTQLVVDVLALFRMCDPYLNRGHERADDSPLMRACRSVWQRFGNDNPEELATLAAQMKEYFA